MSANRTLIPIYTSKGDLGAFLLYPFIYDRQGEWIGWVTPDRQVYSVLGHYVGYLTGDPRILRKRAEGFDKPRLVPPTAPPRIIPPAHAPLPPMMSELTYSIIDVLDEEPELMPPIDYGEFREDLD